MKDKKLETVKEALELIYNPNDFITNESLSPQEIQDKFKQALAELNSYMEARTSEDMVERVAKEIRQAFVMMECGVVNFEKALPIMAKAAIKAMGRIGE